MSNHDLHFKITKYGNCPEIAASLKLLTIETLIKICENDLQLSWYPPQKCPEVLKVRLFGDVLEPRSLQELLGPSTKAKCASETCIKPSRK